MINIIDLGARGGLNFDVKKFTKEVSVFALELDPDECKQLNDIEKTILPLELNTSPWHLVPDMKHAISI